MSASVTAGESRPKVVVVVPWLMGGGAQAALEGVLSSISDRQIELVVLFAGSTGLERIRPLVAVIHEVGAPKHPLGVLTAASKVTALVRDAHVVYSLMRASHVVLGIAGVRSIPADAIFAASFHQLPSADSRGASGRLEDVLVRRAMRRADIVTAPSRRAVDELVGGRFVDSARAHFVPNPLAPRATPPVPARSGRLSPVRLAFVGRLTPQKGLDQLPALLQDVEVPVELRIVGDGPERADLERIASKVRASHRIVFTGASDDVASHLDWCDAIFMPSRVELNPVSLWEARLAGRPAITSDIPAFRDLASDGGVITFADGSAVGAAVDRVANDAQWREGCFAQLSEMARDVASGGAGDVLRDALLGRIAR